MKRDLHRWAYAAAGIAIIIAVMAGYSLIRPNRNTDSTVSTAADVPEDPLRQYILEQEQLRSMQISQLDDIINSDRSSPEIIDSAQRQKFEIVEKIDTEQLTAGMLRARGYTDAAVTAGDGYVTVMVRAEELSKSDAARITQLITERTGIGAENIKIIPIN